MGILTIAVIGASMVAGSGGSAGTMSNTEIVAWLQKKSGHGFSDALNLAWSWCAQSGRKLKVGRVWSKSRSRNFRVKL